MDSLEPEAKPSMRGREPALTQCLGHSVHLPMTDPVSSNSRLDAAHWQVQNQPSRHGLDLLPADRRQEKNAWTIDRSTSPRSSGCSMRSGSRDLSLKCSSFCL